MPDPEKWTVQSITPQAKRILGALSTDEWRTRRDIAASIGRDKLNKWDVAILAMLDERGIIVTDKRLRDDGYGIEHIYQRTNKTIQEDDENA